MDVIRKCLVFLLLSIFALGTFPVQAALREAEFKSEIRIAFPSTAHVALVGANGSGKTTLAKLLLGVLRPSSGELIAAGSVDKSVHCQNYGRYALSLFDNVRISELSAAADAELQALRAEDCLSAFGLAPQDERDSLPEGLATKLRKDFGGVELSGGQWQRIALARTRYRERDFLIFDEPTAAIDPLEEARIFAAIETIAAGRGLLLITHRLALLPHMDHILFLAEGKLIAQGTHQELLGSTPAYREMWRAQGQRYQRL